ncbi:MAG: hypothetical protein EPO32_00275 [Anaerolineae bacterium]|nr:MAG: hypothetical protein EPO32_00275 [Anaerolineae bacterium]
MTESRPSLVKPTLDTLYHIDFEWWGQNDREWRVYLRSLLSPEEQERFGEMIDGEAQVDWPDPVTGEVTQVDGLQHILITHTAQQEGFLNPQTALVEAIFRLFLKNGNRPMSINEIAQYLNRPAPPILKTLSGGRVYKGLRPILKA